jgi:biopolymer transport protein TolR
MSDINMTPLIDVMLVLLVIFMITAPLMTASQPGAGPAQGERHATPRQPGRSSLWRARRQGRAVLERRSPWRRPARSRPACSGSPGAAHAEVQLRADQAVPYGRWPSLIDLVQAAG